MNLLIATDTCSADKERALDKIRKKHTVNPQQKFFRLLIEGLSLQQNVATTVLSALPVSASTVKKKIFSYEEEHIGTAVYHYIPFVNGKIFRYFTTILSSAKEIKKWSSSHDSKKSLVLTDPLVPIVSIPTRINAQRKGYRVGALVTDIPSLSSNMKGRKDSFAKRIFMNIYQRISDKDLTKYDFYITLTESLNDAVNPDNLPYCVIEGFADSKDKTVSNMHENYVMYAGGVYEKFGVRSLVEAFCRIERDDLELWIYGDGPYVDDVKAASTKDGRIKYKGCVSAEEVVEKEKHALLLVNPRPTKEEFAKYSFPSKTMEYLLSGTATVSTRLPGIPNEYFNYLYAFDGDDTDSIEKGMRDILELPLEELIKRGYEGHDFVMNEKNNTVMAKKMISFFEHIL